MTDGMKSGAGSDPFADDSNSDEQASDVNNDGPQESDSSTNSGADTGSPPDSEPSRAEASASESPSNSDDLPYIFERDGVKDNRTMVQYFLREETEDIEADAKRAVEQELNTDVYLTDLREALVRIGAAHIDEVADELREWGYRYKEE
ncbi:hypothetical protein [Halobacterium rubrum]|uniref:hypothetical protein n=1 Tax=Halobacterium TaxID=2239 RepID=UPI001F23D1B8|nr:MULTISPECIES: hypothetical protein [Halobacterium]MDH5021449.1 hypothetical protein [Halobacterium rubrum]